MIGLSSRWGLGPAATEVVPLPDIGRDSWLSDSHQVSWPLEINTSTLVDLTHTESTPLDLGSSASADRTHSCTGGHCRDVCTTASIHAVSPAIS